jgi:hypothetical protein
MGCLGWRPCARRPVAVAGPATGREEGLVTRGASPLRPSLHNIVVVSVAPLWAPPRRRPLPFLNRCARGLLRAAPRAAETRSAHVAISLQANSFYRCKGKRCLRSANFADLKFCIIMIAAGRASTSQTSTRDKLAPAKPKDQPNNSDSLLPRPPRLDPAARLAFLPPSSRCRRRSSARA